MTRRLAGVLAVWILTSPPDLTALTQGERVVHNWTTVAEAGNPPSAEGDGSVAQVFQIGRFEVTNSEYACFLNAKAAVGDPLQLFHPAMQTDTRAGIGRTGSGTMAAPYRYAPRANMADKPVVYVNWFDSVRFVNWLNNGQGDADTESGAYTLEGGTPLPSNADTIARNAGARVWLPDVDEWYKAAYHEPGAPSGGYWRYATRSNVVPTRAMATADGDVANPGPHVANFGRGADWNGEDGNVTTVGGAGSESESYWGTSDQAGNLWEWNEDLVPANPPRRGLLGGSWVESAIVLPRTGFGNATPTIEVFSFGFRVARGLVAHRYCVSGTAGATIDAEGDESVGANELRLIAAGVPAGARGLFFYGDSPTRSPFGGGWRCVGGRVFRLLPPVAVDDRGVFATDVDLTQPPIPAGRILPGSTWYFQALFRVPGSFDLTDALEITFEP